MLPLPASHWKRLCGVIGAALAAFILVVGLLLVSLAFLLRFLEVGAFLAIALQLFMVAAPYLSLIGGTLCIVRLFVADEAQWSTLRALFLHLGIIFITITTLLIGQRELTARAARIAKFDKALAGAVTEKQAFMTLPEIFPHDFAGHCQGDHRRSIRRGEAPCELPPDHSQDAAYLMVEVAPLPETGADSNISPADFVDFVAKKEQRPGINPCRKN